MEELNLGDKLDELVKELGGVTDPQAQKLEMLARKARENHGKLKESVERLQESLDYLRICIKYQLFDLEATRRENQYLRHMLEEKEQ
jgi:hypothetical protein